MKRTELDKLINFATEQPYSFDFFSLLRTIDSSFPEHKRFGYSFSPADEKVRIAQSSSISFAPSAISSISKLNQNSISKITINNFGLLGANGPLPLFLTEFIQERILHHKDDTLISFLNLFNHRLSLLFYRAWADSQATVNLDTPSGDNFSRFISSILHQRYSYKENNPVPLYALIDNAGHLVRQTRNADGLQAILSRFFEVPVTIEQFVGEWIKLSHSDKIKLGQQQGGSLGNDTVLGNACWSKQTKIRIHIGPVDLCTYQSFYPNTKAYKQLIYWLNEYFSLEMNWDLCLILDKKHVKNAAINNQSQLGLSTWIDSSPKENKNDLILNYKN